MTEESVFPSTEGIEVVKYADGAFEDRMDAVATEVPVALVYNGISHTVMMATPENLKEFAVGFSLAEGIIRDISDIYDVEVLPACSGMRVELEIASECFLKLKERRRSMAGRTGCGICGIEQLSEVLRPLAELPETETFDASRLQRALAGMSAEQSIGMVTGCTHAAALLNDDGSVLACFEDVGRHVALDKLLGARALNGWKSKTVLVSSRASYEMVQKAASCGIEILFAISAATGLAVTAAKKANLTLGCFCRQGKVSVVNGGSRIKVSAARRETSAHHSAFSLLAHEMTSA